MAPLTALPLHLVTDILLLLDNIQSLPPALLSHRIFYTAFLDTPSLPLDILRRQLPDDLSDLAIAAYTSQKSIRDAHGVTARQFLVECYDAPLQALDDHLHLTLSQALEVGRMDDTVTKLRNEYSQFTLRTLHGLQHDDTGSLAEKSPSADEIYRITRAFYRFYIYCNLFFHDCKRPADEDATKYLFFDRHSPWVNEQLVCIYDYLETRLTGDFDIDVSLVMLTILSATSACREVVINGFSWGDNLTEWLSEKSRFFEEQRCVRNSFHSQLDTSIKRSKLNQQQLSLGLPRLYTLLQASTSEEWQASLSEARTMQKASVEEDLDTFNRQKRPEPSRRAWYEADIDRLAELVDAGDMTDSEPRRMWTRFHYDLFNRRYRLGEFTLAPMRFVYGLRGLGYVLWDGERLKDEACQDTIREAYRGSHLSSVFSIALPRSEP